MSLFILKCILILLIKSDIHVLGYIPLLSSLIFKIDSSLLVLENREWLAKCKVKPEIESLWIVSVQELSFKELFSLTPLSVLTVLSLASFSVFDILLEKFS